MDIVAHAPTEVRPHRIVQSRGHPFLPQQAFCQKSPHDFALCILASAKSWRGSARLRSWRALWRSRLCTIFARPAFCSLKVDPEASTSPRDKGGGGFCLTRRRMMYAVKRPHPFVPPPPSRPLCPRFPNNISRARWRGPTCPHGSPDAASAAPRELPAPP